MHHMLAAARSHGLQRLHGEVLCHNTAMFALLRRCELACVPHPQESGLMVAERRWQATPAARVVGAIGAVSARQVANRGFDRCVDSLVGLRLVLAAAFSH
jgi:hypothetical protein